KGWALHKKHLLALARLHGKPLTFVEVGYPATNIAAVKPWDYDWKRRRLDFELQKRCFEAFRRTWSNEPALRGFRIWGLSVQSFEPPMGFSPIGKPAEAVVQKLFEERSR